jgi:hypothetical protein
MLLKLFQKLQSGGILPKSFYNVNINLIPTAGKDSSKNESYKPISLQKSSIKFV